MDSNPNGSRKRHILVVEHDLSAAASYKELLEMQGYEVSLASNSDAALQHVQSRRPDAVVCDMQTLGFEGDSFYATMERMQPELARRFVFTIGLGEDEYDRDFFHRVNAPVLYKPVHGLTLVMEVARVIAR